jgi:hypothetical protein
MNANVQEASHNATKAEEDHRPKMEGNSGPIVGIEDGANHDSAEATPKPNAQGNRKTSNSNLQPPEITNPQAPISNQTQNGLWCLALFWNLDVGIWNFSFHFP